MPRVDLDTYTPQAPALIEHGNSSSVAAAVRSSVSRRSLDREMVAAYTEGAGTPAASKRCSFWAGAAARGRVQAQSLQ